MSEPTFDVAAYDRDLVKHVRPDIRDAIIRDWLASPEAERRLARAIAVAYRAPDEPERPDLVVLARAILAALREQP